MPRNFRAKARLKDSNHGQCKFCKQVLPKREYVEKQILRAELLEPQYLAYEKKKWEKRDVLEASGFCSDCDKLAEKLDKNLGADVKTS